MVETRSMKKKRKSKNYSNLPTDLTLLIMQQLSLKDNICASVVCKAWKEACVSVRFKDPTPWLMVFPKDKEEYELYELFDPSLEKTHTSKSPLELRGSHVEHCRDGWLLISDKYLTKTLFFNPFTQERIDLPCPGMCLNHPLAFSCAPTSTSCVIFSVCQIKNGSIFIKLYNLATKVCTPLTLPHRLSLRGGDNG
uniref:F-box protein n=1 Tax=Noccaea caerulescens TaxID=107243 RepID=A0A1J3EG87_NOCCA